MSNLRDPFTDPPATGPPPEPRARPVRPLRAIGSRLEHFKAVALGVNALLLVLVVLGCLAILAESWFGDPRPEAAVDRRFVAIGRSYRAELAGVYARAWEEGARVLDAGQAPEAALEAVAKAWDSGRVAAFERVVTPELARVVAEGKPAKDVTAEDRAKLAAAWRGFAQGLGGGR
jgi:hypothetical protein